MKLLAPSTALGLLIALGAVASASAHGNATVKATAMPLGGSACAQLNLGNLGGLQRMPDFRQFQLPVPGTPTNGPQSETTDKPAKEEETAAPATGQPLTGQPATNAESAPSAPPADADAGMTPIQAEPGHLGAPQGLLHGRR